MASRHSLASTCMVRTPPYLCRKSFRSPSSGLNTTSQWLHSHMFSSRGQHCRQASAFSLVTWPSGPTWPAVLKTVFLQLNKHSHKFYLIIPERWEFYYVVHWYTAEFSGKEQRSITCQEEILTNNTKLVYYSGSQTFCTHFHNFVTITIPQDHLFQMNGCMDDKTKSSNKLWPAVWEPLVYNNWLCKS